jgi:hypothetical protein
MESVSIISPSTRGTSTTRLARAISPVTGEYPSDWTTLTRLELLFIRSLQTGPFFDQTPFVRDTKLHYYRQSWLTPDYNLQHAMVLSLRSSDPSVRSFFEQALA